MNKLSKQDYNTFYNVFSKNNIIGKHKLFFEKPTTTGLEKLIKEIAEALIKEKEPHSHSDRVTKAIQILDFLFKYNTIQDISDLRKDDFIIEFEGMDVKVFGKVTHL